MASLPQWCPKLVMFCKDMDLRKSPDSLQVDSPNPHPFACVMLYSIQSPYDSHLVVSAIYIYGPLIVFVRN